MPHTDDIHRSVRNDFWLAAVRREFGLLLSDELPELAASALAAGLDSTKLRQLAGERHPSWASVGAVFDSVLRDLSTELSAHREAGFALARHYAEHTRNLLD